MQIQLALIINGQTKIISDIELKTKLYLDNTNNDIMDALDCLLDSCLNNTSEQEMLNFVKDQLI